MNQQIKDWLSFCERGTAFEDGYFLTLFNEQITVTELSEIYKSFPNASRLIDKMKKFLFEKPPIFNTNDQKILELEKLLKLDWEDRNLILKEIERTYGLEFNNNLKFVEHKEIVNSLALDDIWFQAFHDFMRVQKISTDRKMYELYNALYGLTYDFDFQLYLYEPLLKTNYSGEYIFQFKRLGGVYAFTKDGIVFSYA